MKFKHSLRENIVKMVGPFTVGLLMLSAPCLSCQRNKEVIPEKELVSLLADLEVAQVWSRRPMGETVSSTDSVGLAVLKSHGVTPAQLDSTMGWYGRNVDDYQELYAKVEKELDKRLAHLGQAKAVENSDGSRDLWQSPRFARLDGRSWLPGVAFSIDDPEIEPGEVVEWQLRQVAGGNLEILLGGEYAGGDNVYTSSSIYSRDATGVKFYTDSTRRVKRLYGTLRVMEGAGKETVLIDSLALIVTPMDSTQYFRTQHQKKYSIRKPVRIVKKRAEAAASRQKNDSVKTPDNQ